MPRNEVKIDFDALAHEGEREWLQQPALRNEFRTKGAYLAWRVAEAKGQARIMTPGKGVVGHAEAHQQAGRSTASVIATAKPRGITGYGPVFDERGRVVQEARNV